MQKELLIGVVLKPQGIRGEIKIKVFTDTPQDIKKFGKITIDKQEYKILSFRTDGEAAYLGLSGVFDRNDAELLRGKNIYGNRDDAPMPEDGTFYIVDLIGCKVVTDTGREIGELVNITPAATDVYTVKQGDKNILFPAVGDVFVKISPEEGVIEVNEERFNEIAVL